jgi:SAM-dependent methyltransferase
VNEIVSDRPFDAAVGRFILMFLPDPAPVLRSLIRLVRPGGVLAFQEPTWIPLLALGAQFPLWSKLLHAIHATFLRSGANPEMGFALHRMFQDVGLPAPDMHIEVPLGSDANFTSLLCDLIHSVRPLAQQHHVSLDPLGDLDTLSDRIQAEVAASNTVVSFVPLVGVWARKPGLE